jgi:L-ascorbate metabolism protein UlaG (beta-lactamase superfamily)
MRITWIGHACFFIEALEGRIVMDPFAEEIPYAFPELEADLVTVSHDHSDHNAAGRVRGNPSIVRAIGDLDVHGVRVRGIASLHQEEGGDNNLYVLSLEGMRIAHLGDLGTLLNETQRAALADVKVLLVPIGGNYTIDAKQAAAILDGMASVKLVIPMHFKTAAIADWPIATVEEFEGLMDNVRRVGASTIEVTCASLPEQREVWILDHA